jgi:aminotransferase
MKDAACTAIHGDINQYALTWGSTPLRLAIAEKYRRWYGFDVNPDTEVTVTCGATEAMAAVFLALVNPGDEVIVLEPFYENYGPDATGRGHAVFVPPRPTGRSIPTACGRFTTGARRRSSTRRTIRRASVHAGRDRPHRVALHRAQPGVHREIYEHILRRRSPLHRTWPMRAHGDHLDSRPSAAGWRLGYAIARRRHPGDPQSARLPTVGAPAPLRAAGAWHGVRAEYYNTLALGYRERRDLLCEALREAGFAFAFPEGAYYVLTDYSSISDLGDVDFSRWLAREIGIATVPGSGFSRGQSGTSATVRFAFCKKLETLQQATERLARLRAKV